jgi:drug/metabolite transporter (DMT)-like permease
MVKFQGLFAIISLALTLFAFVDCAMREDDQLRKLPKWGWLLSIVIFNAIAAVFYLVAGRNGNRQQKLKRPKPRILPPDDDPDFLGKL